MKDQHRLVCRCRENDIPVFVLCGTDKCALRALEEYQKIAKENECNEEFIEDLCALISEFKAFQEAEPKKIKVPD